MTAANFFLLFFFGGGGIRNDLFTKQWEHRCSRVPLSAGGIGFVSPAESSALSHFVDAQKRKSSWKNE